MRFVDVIFSFEAFKAHDPRRATDFRAVVRAERSGEREVTFTFDRPGYREVPQTIGQLPVLPKHWWEGTDRDGNKRDVSGTTTEPPLGSGPYRVKDFTPGRSIVYCRCSTSRPSSDSASTSPCAGWTTPNIRH